MKVYHGTSGQNALKILKEGVLPRGGERSNWQNESGPDRVYVSTIYAPYFAMCATREAGDDSAAIVEIDISKISRSSMLPDEDWCEQTERATSDSGVVLARDGEHSMEARTAWFRDNIDQFSSHALASLQGMGVMAVRGGVPADAITRVSVYKPEENPYAVHAAMDPSITLVNHSLMYEKYEALTQWFMGVHVDHHWATRFLSVCGRCLVQDESEILEVARAYSKRSIRILRP